MENDQPDEKQFVVARLDGLNERDKSSGNDQRGAPSQFDTLEGFIHQRNGVLERAPGIQLLQQLVGKQILNICQTFDSRKNVLVQTNNGLYVFSEDEIVNRVLPTNLVPVTLTEEESMSKAIIAHYVAPAANGGTYTTGNVWQQSPLTAIVSQLNPDGTVATFATLAANIITLAAGNYRFKGYRVMSHTALDVRCAARIFNITSGLPAFNGSGIEHSSAQVTSRASQNMLCPIEGDITGLLVPTQFQIEGKMDTARTNTGFGAPWSAGGFTVTHELYCYLEILKVG